MIIGNCFDGDNDEKLKMLQHGSYYDLLREWINIAGKRRLRYRTSHEWADAIQIWERFREEGCFDHRCIQMSHDLIAARFRQIAQEVGIQEDEMETAWYVFFRAEAAKWLEHDGFLRSFMMALSACNSPAGNDAEDSMFEMMRKQYNNLVYPV